MMKTKLFLFLVGLFSLTMLTSCSDDDEKDPYETVYRLDESTGPFTAVVKYVTPEKGSVQVLITEIPESNNKYMPSVGAEAVILSSNEISQTALQVDDVIKFKILEFKLVKEVALKDSPRFVVIKAKPWNK